jgi:tetrahydromethanopterin S-methyltransferase subunit H
MGANFVIYGSIAKVREIFPACAMADAAIAYIAGSLGMRPLTSSHLVYRIF